jgi:GxxExxY protein
LNETINSLTEKIIAAAMEVHRTLGPGMVESIYEECLCFELNAMGLGFRRRVPLPTPYPGLSLDVGYQLHVLVEDAVMVEIRSSEGLAPLHCAQLLTYLKVAHKELGLLINFNVPVLKHGLKRIVNDRHGAHPPRLRAPASNRKPQWTEVPR